MFNKIVSMLVIICLTSMSLITPGIATAGTRSWIAPPSGVSSGWSSFASNPNFWVSMPNSQGYGTNVSFPKDDYTVIGSMAFDPVSRCDAIKSAGVYGTSTSQTVGSGGCLSWQMFDGERWITTGRNDLGMAGIPSSQISSRMDAFPKTASMVFVAYSPDTAEAVIEIQKIEKTPDGRLVVYRADYTPWNGEENKWRRDYLTPTEASDPTRVGYNPFEAFKGGSRTDPVFHNISWEAVGVATGLAMRHSEAHIAWVAADKTRFTQSTKKSGGLFKKTVTTYIDGYATPQWFVATPVEIQPDGGMSSICVVNVGGANANGTTSTCDAPEHLASSGVAMTAWQGGNMPVPEDHLYSYVNKKSSWTVMAFTILTFAVTWGVASLAMTAMGTGALGISGLQAGLIGAGVYAGVAALNGASLTTVQSGWAGETGNGVMVPAFGSMDQHQSNLIQGVRNKQIYSRLGTGLSGVQSLYHGSCPENYTVAQCRAAGLDPGSMHRSDEYSEGITPLELRQQEALCKLQGLTGADLAKCAAPQPGVWTTTTGQ